jgi:hypothetical protein
VATKPKIKLKKKTTKRSNSGKGKNFEREISVRFSNWLTNGEHDDYVWHTGSSGARGTVRKKNSKSAENATIGDLASAHDSLKWFFDFFSVELKTGYPKSKRKSKTDGKIRLHNWSLGDVLDGTEKKPTILGFWDQAIGDAHKSNREPLLIFRRNQKKPCVVMAVDIFNTIVQYIPPPKFVISRITLHPRFYMPVTVCNLDDFMRLTSRGKMNPGLLDICKEMIKYRK